MPSDFPTMALLLQPLLRSPPFKRMLFASGCLNATHTKWMHKMDFPAMDWPIADFPKVKYPMEDHYEENRVVEKKSIDQVLS